MARKERSVSACVAQGMRPVVVFSFAVALVSTAILPGSTAQPEPAIPTGGGGVLYLTNERFDADFNSDCGGIPERYSMTTNRSAAKEGMAGTSAPATPVYRCETRFEYIAQEAFSLGAKAHVHLTISCDPASVYAGTPGRGAIRLMLANNPDARPEGDTPLTPDPKVASADSGPVCSSTPTVIDVEVPAHNLTFHPGSTLLLLLYVSYVEPLQSLPAVRIHVGGSDPSRLQAIGIPDDRRGDGFGVSDNRPIRYWTADLYQSQPVGQGQCPAYYLAPSGLTPANGAIEFGAARECSVAFVADIPSPRELSGRVTGRFWYWCDGAVAGRREGFIMEVAKDQVDKSIAPPASKGSYADVDVCPQEPTEMVLETVIDPPVSFSLGSRLIVRIQADFLVAPGGAAVHFGVGPTFPSSVRLYGIESNDAVVVDTPSVINHTVEPTLDPITETSDSTSPDPASRSTPLPQAFTAVALLVAGAAVRRSRVELG